jgi:AmiR/NasT family two-component response regulator
MTSEAPPRQNQPVFGPDQSNGFFTRRAAQAPSDEVEQLKAALVSNRRISMAIGILMRDRQLDEHQAFGCLRRASQDSNRKLRDLAEEVIHHRRLAPPDATF